MVSNSSIATLEEWEDRKWVSEKPGHSNVSILLRGK
jgi:hypothetical protein